MSDVRGQAVAMALLALTGGLGSLAEITQGTPDEPHAPITIDGDGELASNACSCVRNPGAAGTPSDPYVIEGWRIQTSGTAIEIRDISDLSFVVRENHIEADRGIELSNTGDRGAIVDNVIEFDARGLSLENSSPRVSDNDLRGGINRWSVGTIGIEIDGGSPTLDDNYVQLANFGIWAGSSSPVLVENEVAMVEDGIRLSSATEARLVDNVIRLADRWGVHVEESAHARLISNEIREGHGGIVVEDAKLYMQGNKVSNQKSDAIQFERSNVQMFRNEIVNNWRGAFGSTDSDVLIKDNLFRDNGDGDGPNDNEGLRLEGSEGKVINNTLIGNDIGISLQRSIITLEDNVLEDNRWGMSIPYSSKGSIPLMSGNVIDGVNVDGTIDASEQRIFYEQGGVEVANENLQAGNGNGGLGTLFLQGSIVVYDSVNVTIHNNTFQYNDVGIHVQESSFVRVRDNAFHSNNKAVVTIDSRTFVKDNECDIEIDPPDTVCVVADGGYTTVRANLLADVDIGVHFKSSATGEIANNTIQGTTKAGLHLEGDFDQEHHHVKVLDNRVEANLVGALLVHFRGQLEANTFEGNEKAGLHLSQRTDAVFTANVIVDNGHGVVDRSNCYDGYRTRCSTGFFVDNTFKHNAGFGVHLENGGSFEGDVFLENGVGADIQGGAVMEGVNASHNEETGIRAHGHLSLEDASLYANGEHGVDVTGELVADNVTASFNEETGIRAEGQADLETVFAKDNSEDGAELLGQARISEGNFSGNGEAGLRLGGTLFIVSDCEASFNANGVIMTEGDIEPGFEVPVPRPPSIGVPQIPDMGGDDDDPLWMHECDIVANEDFAVRANVEARVNATHNFWGQTGPVVDTPVFPGDNVVSSNVRMTPYYETRDHETLCTVPDNEVTTDSPQGCIKA